ncbi:hypothetical protein [Mycolicibacterium sp.]|uniref:hypothetical protein n=1 Tax=Mycolicibacterium sp. TaxID=2320850 RepID=UPI0037C9139C
MRLDGLWWTWWGGGEGFWWSVVGVAAVAALRSGCMANKRTLEQARKEARARLVEAQQKEAERERLAIEDAAVIVRARTRRADVDSWEAKQIAAVAVEADRKRVEHDKTAIEAVQRMRERGESVKTIALLCGLTETEIRKYARQAAKPPAAPAEGGDRRALDESAAERAQDRVDAAQAVADAVPAESVASST